MQRHDDSILYSASDLVAFLACEHATTLSLQHLVTPLPKAEDDASAELIKAKGMEHEVAVLAELDKPGLRVTKFAADLPPAVAVPQTVAAMRAGVDVIYQGALASPPRFGRTDFLRRVALPSRLGDWSYEVVDTKLARSNKAKFAIQLAFYSELVADVQGVQPERMHVKLGNGEEVSLRVADYAHYLEGARARFVDFVAAPPTTYPDKSGACPQCPWRDLCRDRWEADDHLNRVAGIVDTQIRRLQDAGITTLTQLAALPTGTNVPRLQAPMRDKLQRQAALQLARRTGGPEVEILPVDPEGVRGFHRLPPPDAGDIFFDMEGDPLEDEGLEYLFGVRYDEGGEWVFRAFWAHDREQERKAFEDFIDFALARLQRYPDMHVYHYAHYEPHALKELMGRHGTREVELDVLLRGEKFVDLYKVVREGLRTSERGLSIKDLEVFYMEAREGDVKDAGASIVHYEAWRAMGDAQELERIRAYNDDDCRSTQLLRDWLLGLRPANLAWFTGSHPDADGKPGADKQKGSASDNVREIEETVARYREALLQGMPAGDEERSAEQRARGLLAELVAFHRREDKPAYWAVYARRDCTDDELEDDLECLGGLVRTQTPPAREARSWLREYTFPEQETKLRAGDACTRCDTSERVGSIAVLDTTARRVVIKSTKELPDRLSIGPTGPVENKALRKAVWRLADAVVTGNEHRYRAARGFLRREPPRLAGWSAGQAIVPGDGDLAAEALRATLALDDSHLFIQGPPGAGKTTIGSMLIVALLRAGKTVGVTSNSHKVIHNLLHAVEKRAVAEGVRIDGVKKSSGEESEFAGSMIGNAGTNDEVKASNAQLVAGTAWLFADPGFDQGFDYIFVDEAGQVSLANLMAVGTATRNLVLLGDHMQLGQPIQGKHPGHSGESALEYLLDGRSTVPRDRGIFLPTSYRMHEDVCRFISAAVYDGRLFADPANQERRLDLNGDAHPALRPTGIRFHAVEHEGCKQRSPREAEVITELVASLRRQHWVDKDGVRRPIDVEDILVVAPYNAQVNLLREVLPEGARVGTIDKFQGQEAPVVLISMATSSGADLPRNLEFLYDRNRLNVAVSRAQCLAVVVASPALLRVHCNTPEQIALVNTLCWLESYARTLPAYPV